MAKKKKTKKKTKTPSIVKRFDKYFGSGTLEDWQRLCRDVGLEGSYGSITQCRKALERVHVNIFDLLDAVARGQKPHRFRSANELSRYTQLTKKIYPRDQAKEMGPVRALLRHIF